MQCIGKNAAFVALSFASVLLVSPVFVVSPFGARGLDLSRAVTGDGESMTPSSIAKRTGQVGACGAAVLLASSFLLARSSLTSRLQSITAPKQQRLVSVAALGNELVLSMAAFEGELGVQPPLGYWDPAGLAKDGDGATFYRRRTAEIKHGRICMIASLGYIVAEYYRWPGFQSPTQKLAFADIPNGLAAISKVPVAGWLQVLGFCGAMERTFLGGDPSRAPGDAVGCGILGIPGQAGTLQGEEKTRRLNAELANGRLAMVSIIGMFYQDGLTGSAWGDWANYTESPLRAFEGELGVQAPLGYWDPLSLAADGNVDDFKRRRVTEIKHGRVCMIATMGYIGPEYGHWPGYCSPSLKVQFDQIPNGIGAVSKMPFYGWFQIILFCGLMERGFLVEDPSRAPGDLEACGTLGVPLGRRLPDGEEKFRRLSAEIANGRLAMFSIMGMLFQDGLTGKAWGDWEDYIGSPLRAFENEIGVQAPLGFWDPLNYARDGDILNYRRRRVTELKHGRVCMIASIGYMLPEYMRWPGYLSTTETVAQGNGKLSFLDIPNGLGALSKLPFGGWHQIVVFCGIMELNVLKDDPSRAPGDAANCGILGLPIPGGTLEGPEKARRLNGELANGRLAMTSIIGMMVQDGLTGSAWGDWADYTASPLRAFENELGVQAPTGYWDPMGLAADGNSSDFARRRWSEIKHGRVCMFACIGYMTPEYFRWPGNCMGGGKLPFTEIPNGLGAIKVVPLNGWLHTALFIAYLEKAFWRQDDSRAPGDYQRAGVLGIINGPSMPNGQSRTRRLNAEIANGRLAMISILGMIAQDGLTGIAWGDWTLYTGSPFRARENDSF